MQYDLTPAAERALEAAAAWSGRDGSDELEAPALLLGLLTEPECRAAMILARHGIDAELVRGRWPALKTRSVAASQTTAALPRFSSEVQASLEAACGRLAEYPPPVTLATEHLLLGLAAAGHEVSVWLHGQGLDASTLEAEIRRVYRHETGPLSLWERDRVRAGTGLVSDPPCHQPPAEQDTPGAPPSGHEPSADRPHPRTGEGISGGLSQFSFDENGTVPLGTAREQVGDCPNFRPTKMGLSPWEVPEGEGTDVGMSGGLSRFSSDENGTVPLGSADPHPNPLPKGEGTDVLRVLDAAANRAFEGLRTVEDYVRFVLDDRHLTDQCKRLRHDLAAVLEPVSRQNRLAARETQADVGTTLTAASEERRQGVAGVLTANFVRLQEALRSLEEFGKLHDSAMAARLKELRYRAYTLQRAVEITRSSLERLARARLYVLIDGRPSLAEFERLARCLIEAGVHLLQLRDKQLDDRLLLQRARMLREWTRDTETLFIMNDRADLAALSRADGLHVGQEDMTVKDARTIVGPAALIGVSAHSIEQARQAVLDGANYIGVGPTFPSGTKQFEHFPGLDLLRAVAAEIRLPAFAIGGITLEKVPEVRAAGFTRVALSGAITTAADPATAAREILASIGKSP